MTPEEEFGKATMSEIGKEEDKIYLTQIKLDKIKMVLLEAISKQLIDAQVDVSGVADFMRDEWTFRGTGFIWGRNAQQPFVVKTPSSWWQMFKRDYFPESLLNRFPVQYDYEGYGAKQLFPEFRESIPQLGPSVIHVLKNEDVIYRERDDNIGSSR